MRIKNNKNYSVLNTDTKIVSKMGDIWLLNHHKIMCGDSTDIEQIKRLMVNEKADLAFIDPPYNVNYLGANKCRDKIKNDNLSQEEFSQFLNQIIAAHWFVLKRGGSLYICHCSTSQSIFQDVLEKNNFEIRNQIIWAKNHFVVSAARYKAKHEIIFYCHYKKERDLWYGDRSQTTVWQIPKPVANKLHPTMKPIALIEKALINSSKKDDIVIDLCGGSGSTLIACEKLGRHARLMEIEPKYVDATIHRWQSLTKQKAILLSSNECYDELLKQA